METGAGSGAGAETGAESGGKMNKKGPNNPSDSLSVQFKNTKAQVVGTWQKVASSFRQAGKKVSGAVSGVKGKVSSKK